MTFQVNFLRLLIVSAAFAAVGIVIWRALKRRQKDAGEIERLRRLDVNRRGRIVAAEVVDLLESESPTAAADAHRSLMVVYKYEVAGVTYEVSQDLSALPSGLGSGCSPGSQTVSVKYDPKSPTNSIIVCEEWSGI